MQTTKLGITQRAPVPTKGGGPFSLCARLDGFEQHALVRDRRVRVGRPHIPSLERVVINVQGDMDATLIPMVRREITDTLRGLVVESRRGGRR